MCRYCKIKEDDENTGILTLSSKTLNNPIYPTFIQLIMGVNDKDGFFLSSFIDGYEHGIEAKKKIKYCPMCGRKL